MIIREDKHIYFSNSPQELISEIPKGVWLLSNSETRGYFLTKSSDFVLEEKLYGDYEAVAERYSNTFNSKDRSMGVLLSGRSGSGKTLLAKLTCMKINLPVILISQQFSGVDFQNFIANINQELTIFVDEFEKIYDTHEKQNEFLPLLDGVFNKKRLFIFTSNSHDVSKFLLNRPGRVRYHKKFDGLSDDMVGEIVSDLLHDKDNALELIELTKALGEIAYDGLMVMIDEMNLYNLSAREAIKHLNIKVEHSTYNVVLILKGKRFTSTLHTHPLSSEVFDVYYQEKGEDKHNWYGMSSFQVKLHKFNIEFGEDGKITLRDDDNTLVFTKLKEYKFEI